MQELETAPLLLRLVCLTLAVQAVHQPQVVLAL
jgi:hypothetical protein